MILIGLLFSNIFYVVLKVKIWIQNCCFQHSLLKRLSRSGRPSIWGVVRRLRGKSGEWQNTTDIEDKIQNINQQNEQITKKYGCTEQNEQIIKKMAAL